MRISEYRKKNRRDVKTPGGLNVIVRSIGVADFIEAGKIPAAFLSGDPAKAMAELEKGDTEFFKQMVRTVLLNCCTLVDEKGLPTGERIVDGKTPGENEISIYEIAPQDITFLIEAATGQSLLTREAAEQAKPFPEKQETTPTP